VRAGVDSVEMVVVSPFVGEEYDAATDSIRSLWPGHVSPVRVAAAASSDTRNPSSPRVRIQWVDSGATTGGVAWSARAHPDTVGAVRAGNTVLVYPFVRHWRLSAPLDSTMRVYARWVDGTPAAIERVSNGSCTRSVAFSMPTAGDAILRPTFARFLDGLGAPCSALRDIVPLPPEYLVAFAGPANRVAIAKIKPPVARITSWVPWLLGAALLLALLELLVRWIGSRRATAGDADPDIEAPDDARPARRAADGTR